MFSKTKKLLTLCLIHELQPPRILLGMKKRGFGAGRWNGFGGKVAPDETIEAAARRKLLEESGLAVGTSPDAIEKRGIIEFDFIDDSDKTLEVHIFKVNEFTCEPTETDEMRPKWFAVDEIPFSEMWPDDLFWIPLFIKGAKFKGRFLFDRPSTPEYQSQIIGQKLEEVMDFE